MDKSTLYDRKFYRLPEVLELTGLSRSTIYRKIDDGTFPKPEEISAHCRGWRSDEVQKWMNAPALYKTTAVKSESHKGDD